MGHSFSDLMGCCFAPVSEDLLPNDMSSSSQRKDQFVLPSDYVDLLTEAVMQNNLHSVLQVLQRFLHKRFAAENIHFYIVNENNEEMTSVSVGPNGLQIEHKSLQIISSLVAQSFHHRKNVICTSPSSDQKYNSKVDICPIANNEAVCCIPLFDSSGVYIIIEMVISRKDSINQYKRLTCEFDNISQFGIFFSSLLKKNIHFHDLFMNGKVQNSLLAIANSDAAEETILKLFDDIVEGATLIANADRVTLFMIDWKQHKLWGVNSSGYINNTCSYSFESSLLGVVAKSGRIINIQNASENSNFNKHTDERPGFSTKSVLYVPIQNNNLNSGDFSYKTIAVLELTNKLSGVPFDFDDEYALKVFASEIAIILSRHCNEINYLKLLKEKNNPSADLAKRAASEVNLLQSFTSNSSTVESSVSDKLKNSIIRKKDSFEYIGPVRTVEDVGILLDEIDDVTNLEEILDSELSQAIESPAYKYKKRISDFMEDGIPILESENYVDIPIGCYGEIFCVPSKDKHVSIYDWGANLFELKREEILGHAEYMLSNIPTTSERSYINTSDWECLNIDKDTLRYFILAVEKTYRPNPYHNFFHGFGVLHACSLMIQQTSACHHILQPVDILACLVAALCHDVDHPGHTNLYEMNSVSDLALKYSDDSILERHHACVTFTILFRNKRANLFSRLTPPQLQHVRKTIITAILGTDMKKHFENVGSLERRLFQFPSLQQIEGRKSYLLRKGNFPCDAKNNVVDVNSILRSRLLWESNNPPEENGAQVVEDDASDTEGEWECSCIEEDVEKKTNYHYCGQYFKLGKKNAFSKHVAEDRIFLVKTILHAADLSGQVTPKKIALQWSDRIMKEFSAQTEMEKEQGYNISCPNVENSLEISESQFFYANRLVAPLWYLVYAEFPELQTCINNLNENILFYEREILRIKIQRKKYRTSSVQF